MKQRLFPVLATAGMLSAVLLSGCAAQNELAADNQPQPSSAGSTATAVAEPVSGKYTGTQTIELGAPPEAATHIYAEVTCLSAGTLLLPDNFEVTCLAPKAGATRTLSSIPLTPGQVSFDVKTSDPDVTYEVKAGYENGASVR
jgi:hypothetical protein